MINKNRTYLIVAGLFLFYLLVIPHIVTQITPCMQRLPGSTYAHEECVVTLALDRFMLFALLGFVPAVLYVFYTVYPRSLKKIAVLSLIMALAIIVAYYQYIPVSERAIKNAPIILFDPVK
ncbi:hypothetical protein C4579_00140 [Candidatus Microgenomates bacterium]|nr:MAG: hypothetical protein C4579_00140 [Candidatus Microgenomates bacterium]